MNKINVFIVEDHQLIVDAWSKLLEEPQDIEVVGFTGDFNEIMPMVEQIRPDVVLMDINIKGGSGLDATLNITNKLPKTRVIGLSVHDDLAYVKKFIQNGAKGYLTKNTTRDELLQAIRSVQGGQNYVCQEIKDRQFFNSLSSDEEEPVKELTAKEIEIIQHIANGLTSIQISEKLFISKRTVDVHRHNILKKLKIPNAAQLSSWAKQKGYV
jgi:two-component system, NarL family, invasion response regulator UvrY